MSNWGESISAARQDDFATRADMPGFLANQIVHAGRASIRKRDAGGLRPGDNLQIRPTRFGVR